MSASQSDTRLLKARRFSVVLAALFVVLLVFFGLRATPMVVSGVPFYDAMRLQLVPAEQVAVHTQLQAQAAADVTFDYASVTDETREESIPQPVVLRASAPTDGSATSATLELILVGAPADQVVMVPAYIEGDVATCSVTNLRVGATYCYRFAFTGDGRTAYSEMRCFTTDATPPANKEVDGLTNVRDLGGWTTANGREVRQGMVYRGPALTGTYSEAHLVNITDAGLAVMRDVFGIKTEIDLRRTLDMGLYAVDETGGQTSSLLGDDVNYVSCPMAYLDDLNVLRPSVLRVFETLANEDNYPVYFHCAIGRDRTGFVAFLLNGLLGVPQEDLYKDYLFSNMGMVTLVSIDTIAGEYVAALDAYPGDTLQKKIRNYLLDVGLTSNQLDTICALLVE